MGPAQIPPAVRGFKPSVHLLGHILTLNNDPTKDFVVRIHGGVDSRKDMDFKEIDCPFPPIQMIFRAARDKAMSTGDRESVLTVCHYTLWFCMASTIGVGWQGILEMQDRQLRDPFRRP